TGKIAGDRHTIAVAAQAARPRDHCFVRRVAVGSDHGERKVEPRRGLDERSGDVVAVADVSDLLRCQRPAHLLERDAVGQDRTGMRAVGERVDDRLLRGVREIREVSMSAQTRDYTVNVTVQHARRLANSLAHAELDILLAQRRRGAAEAGDPDLEGHARAVGWALEEHRDMATRKRPSAPGACLDLVRQVEHPAELGRLEVRNVEEVPAKKTAHSRIMMPLPSEVRTWVRTCLPPRPASPPGRGLNRTRAADREAAPRRGGAG